MKEKSAVNYVLLAIAILMLVAFFVLPWLATPATAHPQPDGTTIWERPSLRYKGIFMSPSPSAWHIIREEAAAYSTIQVVSMVVILVSLIAVTMLSMLSVVSACLHRKGFWGVVVVSALVILCTLAFYINNLLLQRSIFRPGPSFIIALLGSTTQLVLSVWLIRRGTSSPAKIDTRESNTDEG
jgi:hypothetical protein